MLSQTFITHAQCDKSLLKPCLTSNTKLYVFNIYFDIMTEQLIAVLANAPPSSAFGQFRIVYKSHFPVVVGPVASHPWDVQRCHKYGY